MLSHPAFSRDGKTLFLTEGYLVSPIDFRVVIARFEAHFACCQHRRLSAPASDQSSCSNYSEASMTC
ncbi:Hypothetical protein CAP_1401 [Chondromyces apiculatus DSM 436]|uniref:Uncharacterized protein n=2 Tax=Chondromyces apiculatus TaxID=51 RepID=A0A017SSZ9_9BACT|nr:Hypothetical protein CAP_1401 [Chondromyces apiculatus DSM 436]